MTDAALALELGKYATAIGFGSTTLGYLAKVLLTRMLSREDAEATRRLGEHLRDQERAFTTQMERQRHAWAKELEKGKADILLQLDSVGGFRAAQRAAAAALSSSANAAQYASKKRLDAVHQAQSYSPGSIMHQGWHEDSRHEFVEAQREYDEALAKYELYLDEDAQKAAWGFHYGLRKLAATVAMREQDPWSIFVNELSPNLNQLRRTLRRLAGAPEPEPPAGELTLTDDPPRSGGKRSA